MLLNVYLDYRATAMIRNAEKNTRLLGFVVKNLPRRLSLILLHVVETHWQGWTSLNKNPSWSWSFLAPIILSELELELLGSNFCYQSGSWRFLALNFFHRAGAGAYKPQTFLLELKLELIVLDQNVGAKSRAAKFMFQINLETQLKLYFSNIILVIITTSFLMSNNTGNLPLRKGFLNPHLAFYPKQMDTVN